jgi:hypothetical protein
MKKTEMYCPNCGTERVCCSPSGLLNELTGQPAQRQKEEHDTGDLYYFQRGRECLECKHQFVTAEVEKETLRQIPYLREKAHYLEHWGTVFRNVPAHEFPEALTQLLKGIRERKYTL